MQRPGLRLHFKNKNESQPTVLLFNMQTQSNITYAKQKLWESYHGVS
jgi:hypothetical protein